MNFEFLYKNLHSDVGPWDCLNVILPIGLQAEVNGRLPEKKCKEEFEKECSPGDGLDFRKFLIISRRAGIRWHSKLRKGPGGSHKILHRPRVKM